MKKVLFVISLLLSVSNASSQTCEEFIDTIKSEKYGTTYNSYTSDAISKVTFHEVNENYNTYYFAIVCFKSKYSYGCTEYIYQVASNTKMKYSMNYLDSAGKAFWNYIEPYSDNLECSPDLN